MFFSLKGGRLALVMEYCDNSTLSSYLMKQQSKILFAQKRKWMLEVAKGMRYLHGMNIVHRDLKCDNILLDINLVAKIADFGTSKYTNAAQQNMTKCIGTSHFMAPELVLNEFYDGKVDVFSYAIIMFEVLVETLKPYGDNDMNIETKVARVCLSLYCSHLYFRILFYDPYYRTLL